MAEWSKALRSGRSLFGGVGSNPTLTIYHFLDPGLLDVVPTIPGEKVPPPGIEPGSPG